MNPDYVARNWDLIVLGAGPAGANAALAAAQQGLRVVLVDDNDTAGGQVWRAPATPYAKKLSQGDSDRESGDSLRDALAASSVTHLHRTTVWSVSPGFEVAVIVDEMPDVLRAPAVVAAFGAVERVVPFPGWTLPGVFGLAAATVLLKRNGALPGKQIAVAGQGPLLIAVAAKAISAGSIPTIVVDAARRRDWVQAAVGFSSSPNALLRGVGWTIKVAASGVARRYGYTVVAANGNKQLESVDIAPLDANGAPEINKLRRVRVDTLFVGNGLVPIAEVPRLLGARLNFNPRLGGLEIETDEFGRTSVAGLYTAGDGAGIRGSEPASIAGSLAGLAAAQDANRLASTDMHRIVTPMLRRYKKIQPCANASCKLMQVSEQRMNALPADTIVCRCELVTRAMIDSAANAGVINLDVLKQYTRLGMGPCQGRMCAENAAVLLGLKTGERKNSGLLTQRVPLRPVNVDNLVGTFRYEDIPVPEPAPL